mgnify:CR=1 FL=1
MSTVITTEKPWLANYPKGIPGNVDVDGYSSLVQVLDGVFKKYNNELYSSLFNHFGNVYNNKQP